MAIWLAHYGYHLAIGGLGIVPVTQSFLLAHGLNWLGAVSYTHLDVYKRQASFWPTV